MTIYQIVYYTFITAKCKKDTFLNLDLINKISFNKRCALKYSKLFYVVEVLNCFAGHYNFNCIYIVFGKKLPLAWLVTVHWHWELQWVYSMDDFNTSDIEHNHLILLLCSEC